MYKNILFDFDGTVFDTVEGIAKSVQYALNKHGLDAPLDALRCFAGPPLNEKYIEVFHVSPELADIMVWDFRERYQPIGIYESKPFPKIEWLLTELSASGKKLAITTLKPLFMAEELLNRSGIKRYFDLVRGNGEEEGKYTKAQIIRSAMEQLHAAPEETILIGDTKYDILGAHEAGVKAVGVRYGYAAEGELEAAGADYILDTIEDVREFLR